MLKIFILQEESHEENLTNSSPKREYENFDNDNSNIQNIDESCLEEDIFYNESNDEVSQYETENCIESEKESSTIDNTDEDDKFYYI